MELPEECTRLKEAGNRAFKAGDAKDAFSHYSAAVMKLRELEALNLDVADSRAPLAQASRLPCSLPLPPPFPPFLLLATCWTLPLLLTDSCNPCLSRSCLARSTPTERLPHSS